MDRINPGYYKGDFVAKVIRLFDLGFELGNVIKYILRHRGKNGVEDLEKARWYLDWYIKVQKGEIKIEDLLIGDPELVPQERKEEMDALAVLMADFSKEMRACLVNSSGKFNGWYDIASFTDMLAGLSRCFDRIGNGQNIQYDKLEPELAIYAMIIWSLRKTYPQRYGALVKAGKTSEIVKTVIDSNRNHPK